VKPRVLVVGDRRRPGVAEGVARHRAFLEARLDVLSVDLDGATDLSRAKADLVLVFGGDGSILHVARPGSSGSSRTSSPRRWRTASRGG
jgi:hypothetical protein